MRTLRSYIAPYIKLLPLQKQYLFKKKTGNGLFSVRPYKNAPPVYLRKVSTDTAVFNQVFYRKEYEIDMHFVPKVIVDCGANIGLTSVYFANRFPDATIIAIEPASSNFELLQMNTANYKNIHCHNNGIWNRTTNLEIIDQGLGEWAFMVKETEQENEHTVKAMSIDEIMRLHHLQQIDILKIDIEGSEKELFEKNTDSWLPKVKVLVTELHDRMKKGCSKSFFSAIINYHFSLEQSGESMVVYFD